MGIFFSSFYEFFKIKTLTRYVIKESVGPFFVGLFFFTFILVLLDLLRRIIMLVIEKDVPIFQAMELFVYGLPFNLAITIPMAVLMSSVMAFGRLSADNEIVAMKSSGLSAFHIYLPIAIFGTLAFMFMVFFNEVLLPKGNHNYKVLYIYILNIKPSVGIEEYRFNELPGTSKRLSAMYVSGDTMSNVTVYGDEASGSKSIITAKRGEWVGNEANARHIRLRLYDGMIQEVNPTNKGESDYTPFNDLTINVVQDVKNFVDYRQKGNRELPSKALLRKIKTAERQGRKPAVGDVIEYHKKFTIPAACLLFVLLGAPLGTFSRRSGKTIGFGISVVIIFIYYIFLILGETLGRQGKLPGTLAAWLPNILLAIAAFYSLGKVFLKDGK